MGLQEKKLQHQEDKTPYGRMASNLKWDNILSHLRTSVLAPIHTDKLLNQHHSTIFYHMAVIIGDSLHKITRPEITAVNFYDAAVHDAAQKRSKLLLEECEKCAGGDEALCRDIRAYLAPWLMEISLNGIRKEVRNNRRRFA